MYKEHGSWLGWWLQLKHARDRLMREDTQESLRRPYTEEVEKRRNDNDVDITRLRQQVQEKVGS